MTNAGIACNYDGLTPACKIHVWEYLWHGSPWCSCLNECNHLNSTKCADLAAYARTDLQAAKRLYRVQEILLDSSKDTASRPFFQMNAAVQAVQCSMLKHPCRREAILKGALHWTPHVILSRMPLSQRRTSGRARSIASALPTWRPPKGEN